MYKRDRPTVRVRACSREQGGKDCEEERKDRVVGETVISKLRCITACTRRPGGKHAPSVAGPNSDLADMVTWIFGTGYDIDTQSQGILNACYGMTVEQRYFSSPKVRYSKS